MSMSSKSMNMNICPVVVDFVFIIIITLFSQIAHELVIENYILISPSIII